jgi:hypothetical protein
MNSMMNWEIDADQLMTPGRKEIGNTSRFANVISFGAVISLIMCVRVNLVVPKVVGSCQQ